MINHKEFKCFLNQLQKCNRYQQKVLLNEMSSSIHLLKSKDLHLLLEFLAIIEDFDLEIKLFSLLSIAVASNDVHFEIIILHNPIYEKLETILSRGLCLKTTIIINFITALLYKDAEAEALSPRKQWSAHARNMLRLSGCLSWMISYFINSMVFLDTWKALCQCLAECCRDSPINKDQCSHLVPLCIKKGLQGMTDVFIVLQSLLNGHSKNVQRFLKSNGIHLFKKENLQLTACLHLLSDLAQNKHVSAVLDGSEVPNNVAEILHWSGPNTQKGQWCAIILYYLKFDDNISSLSLKIQQTEASICETQVNLRSKSDNQTDNNKDLTKIGVQNIDNDDDNTAELLRNVMQEIFYWKNNSFIIKSNQLNAVPPQHTYNLEVKNKLITNKQKFNKAKNELSFSFLEEAPVRQVTEIQTAKTIKKNEEFKTQDFPSENTTLISSSKGASASVDDAIEFSKFCPAITSSPKHIRSSEKTFKPDPLLIKTKANAKSKNITSDTCICVTRPVTSRRKIQRTRRDLPVKKLADRSISAKIFSAVNETCTTIVKTVKDIFIPWKKDSTYKSKLKKPNSLSFMEYMKKRDAILGFPDLETSKKVENKSHIGFEVNMCSTCNDTRMLKQKLTSDDKLQTSLKKLKLGINLYGCDFKKISKTLWPHETYMTPIILYNLYRKLILK